MDDLGKLERQLRNYKKSFDSKSIDSSTVDYWWGFRNGFVCGWIAGFIVVMAARILL
jgi:hypothetical protein